MKWNYTDITNNRVRRREERRKLREAERQERERAIFERLPRIAEIEAEQRQIVAAMARAVLTRGMNVSDLQKVGQALAAERTRLLTAAGLSLEDLDLYYDCPLCKDTGWIEPKWEPGQETVEQARKCECLRREEIDDLFRAAGIGGPLRHMNFDA
ncbi:MAG TPA: hypothetical protein VNT75_13780, partial [Symbiobacteriaceae bacterium]|nr:hypothetical protein [Symbiobacteriaceae bacterium]